jgi:hypothetical protein
VIEVVQKFLADPKTNKSSQLIVFLQISLAKALMGGWSWRENLQLAKT